jgi:hypothetical protein|tara:strand:+ start:2167 stop:2370 length:204 start_codon:yes stop_codon:yes gene_type:complete
MAKIGAKVGYTVNLGDFNSMRIDLEFSEIDTEGDVDEQIKTAVNDLRGAFSELATEAKNAVAEARSK